MPGVLNQPHALLAELDRLEASRAAPRGADARRRFRRHVVRGEAELHPMDRARLSSTPIVVHLRDISRGGLGFVCDRPLTRDTRWRVSFLRDGHAVGEQAMLVRHCSEVGENVYLVGGPFVLSDGLVSLLGADPDAEDGEAEDAPAAHFLGPEDLNADQSADAPTIEWNI